MNKTEAKEPLKKKRTEARELLMQLLFQMEVNNDFGKEATEKYLDENRVAEPSAKYIRDLASAVEQNIIVIDENINKHSIRWKTTRLPKVDLAILRLAIGEILYDESLPPQVSINEAVNIAKKYSTDDSGKFINGVLGSIVREKADE
ncbi:MAG: transcription antitermination factor NusB [Eubacteriales bacterium]|nr:transcription antitermination factor NusB [Eubacteriales bacterium]MDD4389455.1 transcription antitermination factor NusB [Eubacteriales bacterium]